MAHPACAPGTRSLPRPTSLRRMCGIVGYVGPATPSGRPLDVVIEGLRRLEYRGYDSAGVAVATTAGLAGMKKAGKLARLIEALDAAPLPTGTAAIGHTRWATHGGPTDANAHPHLGGAGRVAVVHNGIIENFHVLRAELEADGITFLSQTDTEVAAHLLAAAFEETGDLTKAMQAVTRRLRVPSPWSRCTPTSPAPSWRRGATHHW
jgi:glucosamine--fructose-6-phosphate aminotransferase (isomerizing)